MQTRPVMDRRLFVASGLALIATPALQAYYPLPGFLTPEFLFELAADTRRKAIRTEPTFIMGIDRTAYLTEWLTKLADIFERMAGCREPFEALEHEMFETERTLQRKHDYTPP